MKMEYALNTLKIELGFIEDALRKQRIISCELMTDHPDKKHYENAKKQLFKAIELIEVGEKNG